MLNSCNIFVMHGHFDCIFEIGINLCKKVSPLNYICSMIIIEIKIFGLKSC